MIYLDNAASTKPKQEVIDVMVESTKENFANADAIHEFSHKIAQKIKKRLKDLHFRSYSFRLHRRTYFSYDQFHKKAKFFYSVSSRVHS